MPLTADTQENLTLEIFPFVDRLHLQEAIVTVIAESYLALDPTAAAAEAGAGALAEGVTAYAVRFEK